LSFPDFSSLGVIGRLLRQSISLLGYLAVVLIWADLLWTWIFIPIKKFAISLNTVTATEIIADLAQGVCDLYLSVSDLLHQAPKQVLGFLTRVYFYPIDKDTVKDTEPRNSLKSQAPDHDGDCPWNAPELWSYIESESDEQTRAEDNAPIDTHPAPEHQTQALVVYRDPDSTASVTTIDCPSVRIPAIDPGPPRDAITLRARPEQQSPAPRSPTIADNINQINRMKAEKDNPNIPTHVQSPGQSASPSPISHAAKASSFAKDPPTLLHHRQQSHSDDREGVEFIRTPDLDFEDHWPSSSDDEGDLNRWEPLVSTAVPVTMVQERWAMVFDDAKDKDEELDRFEAALGRIGS
ncbi:MAG: hypothetical protein L6R42_002145, partial [Xanthoria sp. 1 TBL-2021]